MLKPWEEMTGQDLQDLSSSVGGGEAFLDLVAPLKELCLERLAGVMLATSPPEVQVVAQNWLAWLAMPIHGSAKKKPIVGYRFNRATYSPFTAFCIVRYGEAPNATHDDGTQGWHTPLTSEDVRRFTDFMRGRGRAWPPAWTVIYGD